jgi:hypothetical protein
MSYAVRNSVPKVKYGAVSWIRKSNNKEWLKKNKKILEENEKEYLKKNVIKIMKMPMQMKKNVINPMKMKMNMPK